MQRPARYSGRLLSKLGRGLSDFCVLFFLEPLGGCRIAAVGANSVSPTAVAPFRRLRDDETTAARLLSFERRKLITVKRINNWAHKEVCSFFLRRTIFPCLLFAPSLPELPDCAHVKSH